MGVPVPLFGLGQLAKSGFVTAKTKTNLYCEARPLGEKSAMVAYGTPGETLFVDFGATPCRGALEFEPNSVAYVVHRGTLWEVNNAGVTTNRGTLNTTSGRVSLAHNGTQVMIVDGTDGYIYNTATLAFNVIVDVDFPNLPLTVTFLAGRFIVNLLASSRFYVSAMYDGLTWDALDFANAESSPDPIVAVWSSNGQLILLGTLTSEYWSVSGNADFAFAPLQGTATEWGLAATWSIAKYDNTLAYVVRNRMGQVMVAKLNGYLPEKISTVDFDSIINGYGSVSNASGYSYMLGGHPMYVLNFPTVEKSWLYDGSTGQFSALKSFGSDRHNAEFSFSLLNNTIVADVSNGRLYKLQATALTDNGSMIERELVSENIAAQGDEFLDLQCLRVDMEVGVGLTGNAFSGGGPNYLDLPGGVGDYASTPDSAALDITGSIDLFAYVQALDYATGTNQTMISKNVYNFAVSGTRSILLSFFSNLGPVSKSSSATIPFINNSSGWLRATFNSTTGDIEFFYSTDDVSVAPDSVSWTQLGNTETTAATSILTNSSVLEIGSIVGGTLTMFDGRIYAAYVYNGISGTLAASFTPATTPAGAATSISTLTGETYTINGTAAIAGNYAAATPGANPQIGLSISRDNGKTWGPQMMKPLGPIGEYGTRVEWRRLGSPRTANFKLSVSDPVSVVFVSATLNPRN